MRLCRRVAFRIPVPLHRIVKNHLDGIAFQRKGADDRDREVSSLTRFHLSIFLLLKHCQRKSRVEPVKGHAC